MRQSASFSPINPTTGNRQRAYFFILCVHIQEKLHRPKIQIVPIFVIRDIEDERNFLLLERRNQLLLYSRRFRIPGKQRHPWQGARTLIETKVEVIIIAQDEKWDVYILLHKINELFVRTPKKRGLHRITKRRKYSNASPASYHSKRND